MKSLFRDESGDAEAPSKTTGAMKSTFKIEINDDEKILRDKQQTTVYHTGAKQGPMIELDEEDRKEMEREALADIDEEGEVEEEGGKKQRRRREAAEEERRGRVTTKAPA